MITLAKYQSLVGQEMAEPRKLFRIEGAGLAPHGRGGDGAQASLRHAEIMQAEILQAIGALAAAIAAPSAPPKTADDGDGGNASAQQAAHLTRIANELAAVTADTARATQKILAAAEDIDQFANILSAALKGKIEQGLAQDIADLVIRIFEACNFQDVTGQRITKVMTTLMRDASNAAPPKRPRHQTAQYLHGPRLDGDNGHVTQDQIDAMFGG